MNSSGIFISYSNKDADFVSRLRQAMADQGISEPWTDYRNIKGGDLLETEIFAAIKAAECFLLIVSPNTWNSAWVKKETDQAAKIAKKRADFRIVPLLLDGTEPAVLQWMFGKEIAGIRIESGPGGISEAMPEILAALDLRLPNAPQPRASVDADPVEELVLKLTDPEIDERDGKTRAKARARLLYTPSDSKITDVESKRFTFTAPLGPIEMEDLRWYLESYYLWPVGVFQDRAKKVEENLVAWGKDLYAAAIPSGIGNGALNAWQTAGANAERRFSVFVDNDIDDDADGEKKKQTAQAGTLLLSLPWELLHDGETFLFQGAKPVRVRRRLPHRKKFEAVVSDPPVRVLLVTARPEDKSAGYIDHRASALPLVDAVETLGDLAELTVLTPATFPKMADALQQARDAGKPFHVVHFDGHGVYDREKGLGGLCFEDPKDAHKLEKRGSKIVYADELADVIRDHRIPLVFLEACQTAQTEREIEASVASALLNRGVATVVAMSHSVLVETARRFVTAFYRALVTGKRVGRAMLDGQRELKNDTFRLKVIGAGDLHLEDWFVPVLFQERDDPQLFARVPSERIRGIDQAALKHRLGNLPKAEKHGFVGRSRDLLALERLLEQERWAAVVGQGGEGKTTLASELARWLVRSHRYKRAAFVSAETHTHARAVLDAIGSKLVPGYSVAEYPEAELLREAFLPVRRALEDAATIIVLDNMETVLPPRSDSAKGLAEVQRALYDPDALETLFALCKKFLETGNTRLILTSREPLPPPYDRERNTRRLGRLAKDEAVELVSLVMTREGLDLKEDETGNKPEAEALVEAVNCHARSLVLLAPHIRQLGIEKTARKLGEIMTGIHEKFPDSREKSLFASVELSLQRLSPDTREKAKVLGVFHGGAHLGVLRAMGIDDKETEKLAKELIETGLAERMNHGHLRLHPALCPYLVRELDEESLVRIREQWAEGMKQLAEYLYQQFFQDTRISAALTVLELPNLMALLDHLQSRDNPEETAGVAMNLETLLECLGRAHVLKIVVAIREAASKKLGQLNHTGFESARHRIERLLQSGNISQAFQEAQALRDKSLKAGEDAYPGADYDIAMTFILLGQVLINGGASDQALASITEAQRRFQALSDQGNINAAHMISRCFEEMGTCLKYLGRFDEAALAINEGIIISKKLNNARQVAVLKGNLGTVRMLQNRYKDAIEAHESALEIFGQMGEPGSVAKIWLMIGMVHDATGNFNPAEQAYRKSLAIEVQQKNPAGEASSLGQLGNLYNKFGRLEEAVIFYRQAADKDVEIGDMANEGRDRNNIANTLIKLSRHDEARREIMRAIECKAPYGHAAEPWTSYGILCKLEQATGNREAAAQARQKAMDLYLAYRRDGGENHSGGGRLCLMFAQALGAGKTDEIKEQLNQLAENPDAKPLVAALQAILTGSRDPALAEDPALSFGDAAEVRLLLKRFS